MKQNAFNILNKYLFPEEWCIAYRLVPSTSNLMNDTNTPFCIIRNTMRYWAADPYVVYEDGVYHLFFEMFDRFKRKGVIGYRCIQDGHIGKMSKIFEYSCHLSFPFIYKERGHYWIIPESNANRQLIRLKCLEFPKKWEMDSIIIDNIRLTDTILLESHDKRYYISQKIDDTDTFDRVDLFYEQDGKIIEASTNPQKVDKGNARCAGRVIQDKQALFRPAQDCGTSYGERIIFNRINSVSPSAYSEIMEKAITCDDIVIKSRNKYTGIHTYNKCEGIEVIDLKLPKRIHIYNVLGIIRSFILRFISR